MNKEFQQKLHYALLQTGHQVDKIQAPNMAEIDLLYKAFQHSIVWEDTARQSSSVKDLIAALFKWQVENM